VISLLLCCQIFLLNSELAIDSQFEVGLEKRGRKRGSINIGEKEKA
jgi:hypothetical protein